MADDDRDEATSVGLGAGKSGANARRGGGHAARGCAEGAEGTGRSGSCAPHGVNDAL